MGSIAHELITRGWINGPHEGPNGEVCLKRAAAYAMGLDVALTGNWCGEAWEALAEATGTSLVGIWNDKPGRTFDEVLRVAKEADEIIEAGT